MKFKSNYEVSITSNPDNANLRTFKCRRISFINIDEDIKN